MPVGERRMTEGAAFILLGILASGCSDTCGNTAIATTDAPAGNLKAVLFQRDCGATTGFSSQVSVLEITESPSAAGNVFIADTDRGAASAASWGGPWVEFRWLSAKHLLIRYDSKARVFKQNKTLSDVNISYERVTR